MFFKTELFHQKRLSKNRVDDREIIKSVFDNVRRYVLHFIRISLLCGHLDYGMRTFPFLMYDCLLKVPTLFDLTLLSL